MSTLIGIYTLVNWKKKLNHGIGLLAKVKHFNPKHLLKNLYFSLFKNMVARYGDKIKMKNLRK